MDYLFLFGVACIGWMVPDFFSAISRGTVYFPVASNVMTVVGALAIASKFI